MGNAIENGDNKAHAGILRGGGGNSGSSNDPEQHQVRAPHGSGCNDGAGCNDGTGPVRRAINLYATSRKQHKVGFFFSPLHDF